jgi:hypothetical protein
MGANIFAFKVQKYLFFEKNVLCFKRIYVFDCLKNLFFITEKVVNAVYISNILYLFVRVRESGIKYYTHSIKKKLRNPLISIGVKND